MVTPLKKLHSKSFVDVATDACGLMVMRHDGERRIVLSHYRAGHEMLPRFEQKL